MFKIVFSIVLSAASTLSYSDVVFDNLSDKSSVLVPIALSSLTFFVPSTTNVAKDPGSAGNTTISGIDSNNDGVRDDVERKIALRFAGDNKMMKYHMILAQEMQKKMEQIMSPTSVSNASKRILRYSDCLTLDQRLSYDYGVNYLNPMVYNTWDLINAFIEGNQKLHGTLLQTESGGCPE